MDTTVTNGAETVETTPAATGASATPPDATAVSSPASEEAEFQTLVEKVQGAKPASAEPLPAEKEETESGEEAPATPEATTDEPATEPEDKPVSPDLSKPAEPTEAERGFSSRPEWKKAVEIAEKLGPKAGQEMRQVMRDLLKTEHTLKTQVEQFKPAVTNIERITKAAGPEGVEGSIRLIEGWSAGDPQARSILVQLLDDFDTRTGGKLSSPELLDEANRLEQEREQGMRTPEEVQKRKAELLELEKARATTKQLQSKTQKTEAEIKTQREQAAAQQRQQEVVTVANSWQKEQASKDPDYPALAGLHERMTELLASRKMQELGRDLNGAEARQVLDEALKQVKAEALKLQPKPKAKVPVSGGNGSSAKTKPVFASEEDEFFNSVRQVQGQA